MPYDYNELTLSFVVKESEFVIGKVVDEVDENFDEVEFFDETAADASGDGIGADVNGSEKKLNSQN